MSSSTLGRIRWAAAIAGAVVAVTSAVSWVVPGEAAAAACNTVSSGSGGLAGGGAYGCAKAGELLDVRIGDVLPTQPSLGYDEVYYKLGRYTLGKDEINKKFDDWCEANGQGVAASATPGAKLSDPSSFACTIAVGKETADSIAPMKTVVIGPGGQAYLTDGHHTLTSFLETPDGGANSHVRLRVLDNLSNLSTQDFWDRMKANGWVWLQDVVGKPIQVGQLPRTLGLANFADDKYRSLMYFGRDIGYEAGTIPFQEFYWGAWMRDSNVVGDWNRNDPAAYLAAVKTVTEKQVALGAGTVVAAGKTAGELGALAAWNDGKAATKGEFAKLSVPYSEAKPGKIAYAIEYRLRNKR
ncbi:ParB/Srx family N-terminal domain-containing protein [Nocardia sp. NPDC005978]|uniref:ParB/Srx family N-terminal domain-containing protein n=1 Tax=Nocardia sp. NPDC005978 TaxID=3156725 RepID=UPI0033B50D1E